MKALCVNPTHLHPWTVATRPACLNGDPIVDTWNYSQPPAPTQPLPIPPAVAEFAVEQLAAQLPPVVAPDPDDAPMTFGMAAEWLADMVDEAHQLMDEALPELVRASTDDRRQDVREAADHVASAWASLVLARRMLAVEARVQDCEL